MNIGPSNEGHHRVFPLPAPPTGRIPHRLRLPLAVLSAATLIGVFPSDGVLPQHPTAKHVQADVAEPAQLAASSPRGSSGDTNEPAFQASNAFTTPAPPAFAPTAALGARLCEQPNTGRGELPAVGSVSEAQLRNAAAIVAAAQRLGLPIDAGILGVQAALGESSLESKDYGDATGPDSRGLFQQRANGAWGSYADRTDPFVSATNFFVALTGIKDWQALPSSIAIHRVQRNQDPDHYTRSRQLAQDIVDSLDSRGTEEVGTCSSNGGLWGATAGNMSRRPARQDPGSLMSPLVTLRPSSPFGSRTSPITGDIGEFHTGQDYAAACGTPVHSANEGTVREVGWHPWGGGNRVEIDHGNGLVTTYNHLQSVAVRKGETVSTADVVGLVGSTGSSTGCHLHFETVLNGTLTDPAGWILIPLTLETSVSALQLISFEPQTGTTPAWNQPQWSLSTALVNQQTPVATLGTRPPAPPPASLATEALAPLAPPTTPPASVPTSPVPTSPPTTPPTTAPPTATPVAPVTPTAPPTTEPQTTTISPTAAPVAPVTPTAPDVPITAPTAPPTAEPEPVAPPPAPPVSEPASPPAVEPISPTVPRTEPAEPTTAPVPAASAVAVPSAN